jgi:3-oxoacyl-[acyl-carrier-protein] synthase II
MKLVVSGYGVVSVAGIGAAAFEAGLASAVLEPARAESTGAPLPTIRREIQGFDPAPWLGDKGLRTLDRVTKQLVLAARLALEDAGLKKEGAYVGVTPEAIGFCCSNAYGSLEAINELDRVAVLEDARYINPSKFPNTVSNTAAGYASIWEDVRALNVSVSDGNCGALDAFVLAQQFFETDRAAVLAVGGGEALSDSLAHAFARLGHLVDDCPLGEGASFAIVERAEHADRRGAKPIAEVLGAATAFGAAASDALFVPSERALERAIASVLAQAGVAASAVDLVLDSSSGLHAFDRAERAAIARAVGERAPVCSPKRLFGESFGASGALAVASALAAFKGHRAAFVPESAAAPRTVLLTSLGYYGNAAAVLLRAHA